MIGTTLRILLTFVTSALMISGCGAVLDTTYAIGGNTYSESSTDIRPTEHSERVREYELLTDSRIECFDRTRHIERSSQVTKTFEYRGGYDESAYEAAMILDGLAGVIIGGTLLAICAQEDQDTSCMNMLWASPFVIDFAYSMIRAKTARNPVLVKKSRSSDSLGYSKTPTSETQVDCGDVESVWLGTASGRSRSDRLNYGGAEQVLDNDALHLPIDVPSPEQDRHLRLSEEAAQHWAGHNSLGLWVKTAEGKLHRLVADRCTLLRPFAHTFDADSRRTFDLRCPLPGQINSAQ